MPVAYLFVFHDFPPIHPSPERPCSWTVDRSVGMQMQMPAKISPPPFSLESTVPVQDLAAANGQFQPQGCTVLSNPKIYRSRRTIDKIACGERTGGISADQWMLEYNSPYYLGFHADSRHSGQGACHGILFPPQYLLDTPDRLYKKFSRTNAVASCSFNKFSIIAADLSSSRP